MLNFSTFGKGEEDFLFLLSLVRRTSRIPLENTYFWELEEVSGLVSESHLVKLEEWELEEMARAAGKGAPIARLAPPVGVTSQKPLVCHLGFLGGRC